MLHASFLICLSKFPVLHNCIAKFQEYAFKIHDN